MNEHGSTTQNVIILSILVLIAILVALLLYRTVSDESANIERAAQEVSDITLFSERECPQGQVRNAQTNECETDQTGIRECPQGQVRNLANECVAEETELPDCPQGQVRNLANECVAEETELPDCPQGQVRNTQTNECEQAPCADNEIRNDEGQCVVGTCPQGQVRNAQTNECVPESTDDGGGGDVDEPLTYWTGLVESIYAGNGNTCVVLGDYSSADGLAYLEDGTYSEIRCWGYDIGISPIASHIFHTETTPPITSVKPQFIELILIANNRFRTNIHQNPRGPTSIPKELPGLSGTAFKEFATSHNQFCKITASNAVICYGHNLDSALGMEVVGTSSSFDFRWPEPEVGQHYLQTQHAVYDPPFPQPGYLDNPPTIEMRDHFWTDSDSYYDGVARQGGVKGGIASETPVSLHTGKGITCAITASDKVFCWGSSSFCESYRASAWTSNFITDGTDEGSRFPFTPCEDTHLSTEIPALSGQGVTQLAIGDEHMCALWPRSTTGGTDGNVKCWGSNDRSQLGSEHELLAGVLPERRAPVIRKSDTPVAPHDPNNLLVNAKKIVGGQAHTCAITATDTLACWGQWGAGGGISIILEGVSHIPGPTNVVDIVAGGTHTCWVTSADIVSCIDEIMIEDTIETITPLVKDVHISEGVKSMSVGAGHICILTNTNTIRCAAAANNNSVLLGLERGTSFSPNTLYEVRIPYNGDS